MIKGLIKTYYQNAKGIAPPNIEKLEFGFGTFENKIAYRHYAFKNEASLRKYLVDNAPPFVSVSSSEYLKPDGRPMEAKGLIGSWLVFDLDADDLSTLKCKLEHGKSWVCERCLDGIREETVHLIEDFLIPDFGFDENDMQINFSGNRGYHVHVYDKRVYGLSGDARKQIGDYITGKGIELTTFFPTLGMRGKRLDGPKPTDCGWGGKLANGIIRALNDGVSSLMDMGIDKKSAELLVRKRAEVILGITTGNWDMINIPKKGEFWSNVLKGISIEQSESIDKNVTGDISKVLRLPDSIHGDTGLIAKRVPSLKALKSYDPMTDAIAFKEGRLKVHMDKVPKFRMNGEDLGPFENVDRELPTYAAVYLILKKRAACFDINVVA